MNGVSWKSNFEIPIHFLNSNPGNVSQGESICPGNNFCLLHDYIWQNAFPADRKKTLDGASWKSIFEISIHFLIPSPAGMSHNERVYALERFSACCTIIFCRMHFLEIKRFPPWMAPPGNRFF